MIVWLASYPRSGNTFFRVILNSIFSIKTYSLYDDKSDIGADEKTSEIVGHQFLPEDFDIQKARDEKKVYYIKTHELFDDRVAENDRVIYLIRDGRESTLSFTKHLNIFSNTQPKIIDTIYGNTFIGSWGDHVRSWNPKHRKHTLLIKFEELTKEPIKYIDVLSDFLQIKPVGNEIPTFEELKKINPKFFRSGKTSSWEGIYTDEEHISFWLKNYKEMQEYGYDYKKPELIDHIADNSLIMESINQNSYLMKLMFESMLEQKKLNSRIQRNEQELNRKQEMLNRKQEMLNQKNDIIREHKTQITLQLSELDKKQEMLNQKNQIIKDLKNLLKQQEIKNPLVDKIAGFFREKG